MLELVTLLVTRNHVKALTSSVRLLSSYDPTDRPVLSTRVYLSLPVTPDPHPANRSVLRSLSAISASRFAVP